MYIKVGNAKKTKFWKDGWIDQTSLRELFPDLFVILFLIWENLDAKVSACWTEQGWDISLKRLLNECQVERVAMLLGKQAGMIITTTATYKILREHSKDGVFQSTMPTKENYKG